MLKREKYLEQIRKYYNEDEIKLLVGLRKSGKTSILYQVMEELYNNKVEGNHMIYINYDFIENEELKDYKILNQYLKDRILDEKIYYIFLDEVQNVNDLNNLIKAIKKSFSNISIFLTSSNNTISLESSIKKVVFNIYPLSYVEYIKLTSKDPYDMKTFWDYASWGGLVKRFELHNEDDIKNYLNSTYDSIILNDILNVSNLKEPKLLNMIYKYLIDNIGNSFSATDILKYLEDEYKTISSDTLYTYIDALCKSLIITKVNRLDLSTNTVLKTLSKYYVTDLGLATIKTNSKNFKKNTVLENIVCNELLNKGYEVYIGKTNKGEISFIAKKDKKKKYIQVSHELKDIDKDYNILKSIKDNDKVILTLEDHESADIEYINIIDFLMNN